MKVYLICSARNQTADEVAAATEYVTELEAAGHEVHYPPRDVEQTDDGCGLAICVAHLKAMLAADEVHVLWNADSKGSHFDLGMAFMLRAVRPLVIRSVGVPQRTPHKSYGNVLLALAEADRG